MPDNMLYPFPHLAVAAGLFRCGKKLRQLPGDVAGAADPQGLTRRVAQFEYPRCFRQFFRQCRVDLRRQNAGRILRGNGGGDLLRRAFPVRNLPELVHQLRIGQSPVTCRGLQTVPFDQCIQTVPLMFRIEGA